LGFCANDLLEVDVEERAAFLVRGLAATSFEVEDPDEQEVAVRTSATTSGKDNFFNFMKLLVTE
jgi:hypothetical protein